ncbi:hypothetical protein [Streptomyces sp. 891-h]|uniref:hypothetical protein n=1 Tax=unclassified Streptomyces TaxID=2593676 RepID=UPI001FA9D00B|nr:hypothetical protein [Streptomyces sp. 891-h]UNZ17444.1 hypothetical protein HC362_10650 [Streptomyces sp. 891-h]
MIWEALGSAALGFALALAATRRLTERLPDRRLVLATGPVAALVGGLICHTVLGPGHLVVTWCVALGFSTALLSLLLRDESPGRRQWRQDALPAAQGPAGAGVAFRQRDRGRPSASYGPR